MSIRSVAQASVPPLDARLHLRSPCQLLRAYETQFCIHIYAYRYGHMSTRKGIKLSGELGDSRLLVFFTHEVKNPPENTLAGVAAA